MVDHLGDVKVHSDVTTGGIPTWGNGAVDAWCVQCATLDDNSTDTYPYCWTFWYIDVIRFPLSLDGNQSLSYSLTNLQSGQKFLLFLTNLPPQSPKPTWSPSWSAKWQRSSLPIWIDQRGWEASWVAQSNYNRLPPMGWLNTLTL